MRFPLKERPLDLLKLSAERLDSLEQVAADVVEANLKEFHDFVQVHNRSLPKSKYKPIKKHDKVTIYKELTSKNERVFGPQGQPQRDGAPLLPKLVATGTVRGRLDDMMLGTAVQDAMAVVVKTSYVNDEIVDCAVHEIDTGTEEDPFHYLSIKWVAKAHPSGLNAVVSPRDMLFIQSSGFIANEGIGFHMLHSVDELLPEIGTLEEKYGILRARVSVMFMFRQLTPETVEVYTVNYVEPNGSAPEAVTIKSTAASMGGIWRSLDCAYNMKLSWILKNKEIYLGSNNSRATISVNHGDKCELCHKRSTLTGTMGDCSLCEARVCSRCRETKKLSKANRRLELQIERHNFCKTCLYRAVNEDAFRIAQEMNVGVPIKPWHDGDQLRGRKFSYAGSNDSRSSSESQDSFGSYLGSSRLGRTRRALHKSASTPARESSMDFNAFEFTRLVDRTAAKPRPSGMSVEDLDSDEESGWGLSKSRVAGDSAPWRIKSVDSDEETKWSIPKANSGRDSMQQQQFQEFLAQEHARKKQELEEQYKRQLFELEQIQQREKDFSSSRSTQASSCAAMSPASLVRLPSSSSMSSRADASFPSTPNNHLTMLYEKMKTLQIAADKTFEIARENERKQTLSQRHG